MYSKPSVDNIHTSLFQRCTQTPQELAKITDRQARAISLLQTHILCEGVDADPFSTAETKLLTQGVSAPRNIFRLSVLKVVGRAYLFQRLEFSTRCYGQINGNKSCNKLGCPRCLIQLVYATNSKRVRTAVCEVSLWWF